MYVYILPIVGIPIMFAWMSKYIDAKFGKQKKSRIVHAFLGTSLACIFTYFCRYFMELGTTTTYETIMNLVLLWILCIAVATDLYANVVPYPLMILMNVTGFSMATAYFFMYDMSSMWSYVFHYIVPPVATFFTFVIFNIVGKKMWDHSIGGGDIFMFTAIAFVKGWIILAVLVVFAVAAVIQSMIALAQKKTSFPLLPSIFVSYVIVLALEGMLSN